MAPETKTMRTTQSLLAILIGLSLATAAESAEANKAEAPPAKAQSLDYVGQLAAELEPTRVVVYKQVGGRDLHLNIFEPEGHQPTDHRACFLTIHGGGWTGLEPRRQYLMCHRELYEQALRQTEAFLASLGFTEKR